MAVSKKATRKQAVKKGMSREEEITDLQGRIRIMRQRIGVLALELKQARNDAKDAA